MISNIFLASLLALPVLSTQNALATNIECRAVKAQHRELGTVVHPIMIGNLYAKAMLKIATIVAEENYETFEDVAKPIIQNSKSNSLKELKTRAKNYNYWQKDTRISNADFALTASLLEKLDQEELAALNLVYLATKNDSKINFSEIIYKLIARSDRSVIITTPLIMQKMEEYPTTCLKERFEKNQATIIINKMNMSVADNQNIVKIEDNKVFLNHRLLAQLPTLRLTKKKYVSTDADSYNIDGRLLSEVGGSFNSYRKSNAIIHDVSNLETIKHFHKFYGLSNFSVINKQDKTITLYDETAKVLQKIDIQVPSSDDRLNAGGAGIYYGVFNDGNSYYAKALSDDGMREIFKLRQSINLEGPIYILPQEKNAHKFRIKNKRLAFSGYQFYRKSRNYNYSIDSVTKFNLEIKHNYDSKFVSTYINTLETEKNRLMQILKVDNDDYNILAGFAIGVLAPESNFGKSWKYVLKEFLPGAVSLAKGNGLDTSKNSRGPTQLKVIPEEVMNQYGINKANLADPENAAVATIAISADFLKQLRTLGVRHKSINEENIQNYMYYLYQGKRVQIKDALATPEDNLAIKKIMNVVLSLDFLEY